MDIVFCGTPQFAVPTLEALLGAGDINVRLVVCQPDRPAGRGMQLQAPPVKQLAIARGLPVMQPDKIKNNQEFRSQLEAIRPEAIVVVAYGRIIPEWMLALPPLGNINLHASLLPKYRGAAPIQWAIARGEDVTGATTMRIDSGLDTGDLLLAREILIEPDDTAQTLAPRLAALGAPLVVETLRGLKAGSITPRPQDDSQATLAPLLKKEDGLIDFNRSAVEIFNRLRGFTPWPGAYTRFRGRTLNLWEVQAYVGIEPYQAVPPNGDATKAEKQSSPQRTVGELMVDRDRLYAGCGHNSLLEIVELQPEGKRRMSAREFISGYRPKTGERLGNF